MASPNRAPGDQPLVDLRRDADLGDLVEHLGGDGQQPDQRGPRPRTEHDLEAALQREHLGVEARARDDVGQQVLDVVEHAGSATAFARWRISSLNRNFSSWSSMPRTLADSPIGSARRSARSSRSGARPASARRLRRSISVDDCSRRRPVWSVRRIPARRRRGAGGVAPPGAATGANEDPPPGGGLGVVRAGVPVRHALGGLRRRSASRHPEDYAPPAPVGRGRASRWRRPRARRPGDTPRCGC